jgi:squalene cyclase
MVVHGHDGKDRKPRARRLPAAVTMGLAAGLCALVGFGGPGHWTREAEAQRTDTKASAVARACGWLAKQQLPNGSLAAPGKILNVDVWETAVALVSLLRCSSPAYHEVIAKGFRFLDENWNDTGGLPESATRRFSAHKSHCVETTSTAIHAYAAAGRRAQAEKLRDFLLSKQEADGGWKIGYPEAPTAFPNGDVLEVFPSVTGFALYAITDIPGGDRAQAERGLTWLASRQKAEGDWGAFPDYFWAPYYATAPIVAAFAAWGRRDDPVVERAIRFTREHQNPDGSWGDAGVPGTTSRELWTTLALLTLKAAGDRAPADVFDRGVSYLLGRQQPDGRWIGGHFRSVVVPDTIKKEDFFTTAYAIVLLSP